MNEPPDPNKTTDLGPADSLRTLDQSRSMASTDRTHPVSDAQGMDFPSVPGYRVVREIARGGMGKVLAARDLTLQELAERRAALRRILASRSSFSCHNS